MRASVSASLADIPLIVGADVPGHGFTAMGRPAALRKGTWRSSTNGSLKVYDNKNGQCDNGLVVQASFKGKLQSPRSPAKDVKNSNETNKTLERSRHSFRGATLGSKDLTKFEEKLKESRVRELRKIIDLHKREMERYEATLEILLSEKGSHSRKAHGRSESEKPAAEHREKEVGQPNGPISNGNVTFLDVKGGENQRRFSDGAAVSPMNTVVERDALVKSSPAISCRSTSSTQRMNHESPGLIVETTEQGTNGRPCTEIKLLSEDDGDGSSGESEKAEASPKREEAKATKVKAPSWSTKSASSRRSDNGKEQVLNKTSAARVLIIDDDVLVLRILEKKLRDSFRLEIAESGVKGLNVFKHFQPDLVIVDALMPDMSGYGFCEVIRKQSNVPVVFLTSLGNPEERLKAYEVGADDYFVKPVRPLEIKKRIEELLQGTHTLRGKLNHWMGPSDAELPMEKVINQLLQWKSCPSLLEDSDKVSDQLDFMMQVLTNTDGKDGAGTVFFNNPGMELKSLVLREFGGLGGGGDYRSPAETDFSRRLRRLHKQESMASLKDLQECKLRKEGSGNSLVDTLLSSLDEWTFNIFDVSRAIQTEGVLFHVCRECMFRLGLIEHFSLDLQKFDNFLRRVEKSYHAKNSYHNALHVMFMLRKIVFFILCVWSATCSNDIAGTDVCFNIYYFIRHGGLSDILTPLESLCLFVSAIVHDIDHPGFDNNFQVTTSSDLALKYNDRSVLENHHVAYFFSLLRSHPECDFLSGLPTESKKTFRRLSIAAILATDLSQHFEILQSVKGKLAARGRLDFSQAEDRVLLLQLALKAADICHVTKDIAIHRRWCRRVQEEFWCQGDVEKDLNMSPTAVMDRAMALQAKSHRMFYEVIVAPLMDVFVDLFPAMDQMKKTMMENMVHWQVFEKNVGKLLGAKMTAKDLASVSTFELLGRSESDVAAAVAALPSSSSQAMDSSNHSD